MATSSIALRGGAEVQAPSSWRAIDFISDLHLDESRPGTFAAWAAHLRQTPAQAVFILGDLFEVWVGDDAREGGFEARCIEVLAEAGRHRWIGFMAGNRDFLLGRGLLDACGVTALADPCVLHAFGQRWLLSHGDALCLADTDYQRFRVDVRSEAWQRHFLAQPLVERRRLGAQMRAQSEQRQRERAGTEGSDVDATAARESLREHGAVALIHGHTHRPATHELAPGRLRYVLSDWDLDHDALHPRAQVLRLSSHGLQRVAPSGSAAARP